jgi:hypothetical protein
MDTLTLSSMPGMASQHLAFEGMDVLATFFNPDYPTPNAFNVPSTFDWTVGQRKVTLAGLQYASAESMYTPGQADVGKTIAVSAMVPYFGVAHTAASPDTLTVLNVNDLPTGTLTIAGDTQAPGSRLQAVSTIADEDGLGMLSYQWKADGKDIPGATGASLTLGQAEAEAGKTITVVASYVDGFGQAESVASDADPQAAHRNTWGTIGITGTLAAGQTLHAAVQDPDGIGTVYYQWQTGAGDGNYADAAGAWGSDFAVGASAPAVVRVLTAYADRYGVVESHTTAIGTQGADTISTAGLGETILANGGNDAIVEKIHGSAIDGGDGLDTVITSMTRAVLVPSTTTPDTWLIENIVNLAYSTSLTNVERVLFSDGADGVALDFDGHAGQAYRLYQAAFDRTPDKVGIGFWMAQLNKGMALADVANAFVASSEFKTLYGATPGNADIVAKFYEHVLHREPDAQSQFWVDVLDRKAATVAEVLVGFSESAENVAALVGVEQQGIAFTPYTG